MGFDDVVRRVRAEQDWREVSYFRALADGSFAREDFVETQVQFLFAVVFFNRPMAVLAARLPRPLLRRNLLDNVAEEHGEGDLARSHEATFHALLSRLGEAPEAIGRRALWPEVRAFNTTLTGLCLMDDPVTAVAALGMIEDLFAEISAFLGEHIAARGWLARSEIVHYALHETLDVEHASEFYALVRDVWDRGPRQRYAITQGLELGAYVFLRMYRDLFEARERRALRDVTGPHASVDRWGE